MRPSDWFRKCRRSANPIRLDGFENVFENCPHDGLAPRKVVFVLKIDFDYLSKQTQQTIEIMLANTNINVRRSHLTASVNGLRLPCYVELRIGFTNEIRPSTTPIDRVGFRNVDITCSIVR